MNNYETILRLLAEKESLQERVKEQWEEFRKYDYECFSMSHIPMFLGSDTPFNKRKYIMKELGYIEDEIKKVDEELGNIPEYSSQAFWDRRLKEEGLPLVKPLDHSSYIDQVPNQGNKSALERMVELCRISSWKSCLSSSRCLHLMHQGADAPSLRAATVHKLLKGVDFSNNRMISYSLIGKHTLPGE